MQPIIFKLISIFFVGFNLASCTKLSDRGHDHEIESQVIKLINKAKHAEMSALDLTESLGFKPIKICFQGPYLDKESFQQATGIKSETFEPITKDTLRVWWLINEKGELAWVEVPRLNIADKSAHYRNACVDLKKEHLFIKCDKSCEYSARRK